MEAVSKKQTRVDSRISELEALVETISRGKLQWEGTFDAISDPVVIIDSNYHILRANLAMAKACSIDVKELNGKLCYQVLAGYDQPFPNSPVTKTLQDHKPHRAELSPFPKTGRQYDVSAFLMPGSEESSENVQIILHFRDITEEKKLQKQVMQTDKMAAIGTLAGGIAHEINNPLGAILAHVQLVREEIDSGSEAQESLQHVEEAVLRCRDIVRDLLDFSRQNFDEQMKPVSLNDVVEKTMALVQVNARHSEIQIEKELDTQLPDVFGHPQKLQQVLLNLVTNAIHAMIPLRGGVLRIKTEFVGDQVCLSVTDTGQGIEKKHLSKIFDPFFTTKDQGEGTGLGLSISYKIIQEHDGDISVESQVNKGTTFKIQFQSFTNKGELL